MQKTYRYALSDICMPCIYKLMKDGIVVYVGQTRFGLKRVLSHLPQKNFDSVELIPCKIEELDQLEIEYICKYQPFLNNELTNCSSVGCIRKKLKDIGYNYYTQVVVKYIREHNIKTYELKNKLYIANTILDDVCNGIILENEGGINV